MFRRDCNNGQNAESEVYGMTRFVRTCMQMKGHICLNLITVHTSFKDFKTKSAQILIKEVQSASFSKCQYSCTHK